MDFITNNANIFFFVTTILVIVLIIICLMVLFLVINAYRFIQRVITKGDVLLEETKSSEFIKKGAPMILPILLPVLSFFAKKKMKKTK